MSKKSECFWCGAEAITAIFLDGYLTDGPYCKACNMNQPNTEEVILESYHPNSLNKQAFKRMQEGNQSAV